MKSSLVRTEVRHARLAPIRHEFSYKNYYYALNLDELPRLSRELPLFGYNCWRPFSIFDGDYLGWSTTNIKEAVKKYIDEAGCQEEIEEVILVTSPRFFGYVFNPVSFYFCYNRAGKMVCNIAEINNTFWERHLYVLFSDDGQEVIKQQSYQRAKSFHVSPFYKVEDDYHFTFKDLSEGLDIRINIVKNGDVAFMSRITGEGIELTNSTQVKHFLRQPLAPILTMPRIMYQAVLLWLWRRLPVNDKPNPCSEMTIRAEPYSWVDQFSRHTIRKLLNKIERGFLTLQYPDGREEHYGSFSSPLRARLVLKNFKPFWKVLKGGSIGLGESFSAGDWEADDLAAVLKIFLNNSHVIGEKQFNKFKPARWLFYLGHILRGNSKKGSKDNIEAHYDLSNDLFEAFLDKEKVYSSAIYSSSEQSLEDAQKEKIRTVIAKAQIRPGDQVLEIGSGWGALAIETAKSTGCSVDTITLSNEQKSYVDQKIQREGLQGRVRVLLKDYRDVSEKYDRVISIEMLEAVGHKYLADFFMACDRVLKPEGVVVLQVITFPDQHYKEYLRRCDWIQKYIFPGSHLPSLSALTETITDNTDFVVESVENFAPDYARTLAEWRRRFSANDERISELGFDDRFKRMWNFYLASCEAEFATRWLGLHQIVLTRSNNQGLIKLDEAEARPADSKSLKTKAAE